MRALQFTTYGGPEVLRWAEAPDPHAGPGQIRIAVRAASVNPIDWKMLAGAMSGGQPLAGTGYLGFDAAGVVDEVGQGVTGVSVGDEGNKVLPSCAFAEVPKEKLRKRIVPVTLVLAKRLKDIIFTNCGSWCGPMVSSRRTLGSSPAPRRTLMRTGAPRRRPT